jgi:hypothetical protein
MAHYQVKITIQATRLPDPPPEQVYDPGKDPMHEMADAIKQSVQVMRVPYSMPGMYRESGLTLAKEIEFSAESFDELSKALGQFDALAEQIECANPTKKW